MKLSTLSEKIDGSDGHFAQRLAQAFQLANRKNRAKLARTFPVLFAEFAPQTKRKPTPENFEQDVENLVHALLTEVWRLNLAAADGDPSYAQAANFGTRAALERFLND